MTYSIIIAIAIGTVLNLPQVRALRDPIPITSDYVLTEDIAFAGDGFIIKADGITLDLSGYTITGSGVGTGVILTVRDKVTVKKGRIMNFSYGIYLEESQSNMITGNVFMDNNCSIYLDSSKANNVTENTFKYTNCGMYMDVPDNARNRVTANNFSNNAYGIYLEGSANTIAENILTNCTRGIYLYSSDGNTITGNNLTKNLFGVGLDCSGSNFLRDNGMVDNLYGFGVWGDLLSDFINNIDASNKVNGKPVYYWVNNSSQKIPFDAGYVGIVNSSGIVVRDLNLGENGQGVMLAYTRDCTVQNVNASNNLDGIDVYYSHNNKITGNALTNNNCTGMCFWDCSGNTVAFNMVSSNRDGIFLFNCGKRYGQNTIECNTIVNNSGEGILLSSGNSSVVKRNTLLNNYEGIKLDRTSNNLILGNNIVNSNTVGIYSWFSNYNSIRGNTITNSDVQGIRVYQDHGDAICYNNLIGNRLQASSYGTMIRWDDSGMPQGSYDCPVCGLKHARSKGNYWSDYSGRDDGSGTQAHNCLGDGVGDSDTPHQGVDNYPLTAQWMPIEGDLNFDGIVDIYDALTMANNWNKTT